MKKQFIWISALALSVCAFFGGTAEAKAAENDTTKIEEGVYIGTVNVGGMTEAEAYDAISAYVDSLMSTTFTLKGVGDKSMELTAEEMGVSCDPTDSVNAALEIAHKGNLIDRFKEGEDLKSESKVLPLVLEVDKQVTANLIYKKHFRLSKRAVNASLKKEDGEFKFVPGTDGEVIDEVNSVYEINRFLQYDFDGTNSEITLATTVESSKGKEDELAQVKDVLGEFRTNFTTSAEGRRANVIRATELIDGTILYPGEEFSVHDAISPINSDNGYQIAHAYSNGQVIDSVGGGVCQVATTVYNAAMLAELDITMRFNHSMTVTYTVDSGDATISGDTKDLRFVNTTDTPIYIEGYTSSGWLYFKIYGHETRPSNREVSFESEVLSVGEPSYEYVWTDDEIGYYKTMQTAHLAMKARLWKIVKVDGKVESREIFNTSTYKEGKQIVHLGKAGATAEHLKIIKDAIATGDDDQVRAAVMTVRKMLKAEAKKKKQNTGGDNTGGDNTGDNSNTDPGTGTDNGQD